MPPKWEWDEETGNLYIRDSTGNVRLTEAEALDLFHFLGASMDEPLQGFICRAMRAKVKA